MMTSERKRAIFRAVLAAVVLVGSLTALNNWHVGLGVLIVFVYGLYAGLELGRTE